MGFSGTNLELKLEDFSNDPALRKQFKIIMNSMLGKLAQEITKEKGQFVSSKKELDDLMKTHNITNVNLTSNTFCHVNVEAKKVNQFNKKGNCIVYAFITARTRIFMHQHMTNLQKCGFKLFYSDCDSIIFSGKKDTSPSLPIGFAFGEFKAELGLNTVIKSFSCLGRKQFRLEYFKKETKEKEIIFKLKGISLESKIAKQEVLDKFPKPHALAEAILSKKKICIPQVRRIQNSYRKQLFHVTSNCSSQRKCGGDDHLTTYPWGFTH